ncbi:MAG: hypothetical protein RR740_00555 [Pseudomonas sp.]
MSLQTLFQDKNALARFELKAQAAGYRNFSRRGQFYCLSDLNTFAAGFIAATKGMVVFTDGVLTDEEAAQLRDWELMRADVASGSQKHQDFYQVEVLTEAEMYAKPAASLSFEARDTLLSITNRLNELESSPAYQDAEYIRLCGELIDDVTKRREACELKEVVSA